MIGATKTAAIPFSFISDAPEKHWICFLVSDGIEFALTNIPRVAPQNDEYFQDYISPGFSGGSGVWFSLTLW